MFVVVLTGIGPWDILSFACWGFQDHIYEDFQSHVRGLLRVPHALGLTRANAH